MCFLQQEKGNERDRYPLMPVSAISSPIKKAKADDVKRLAVKYLPAQHQQFYANIPSTTADDDSDEDESGPLYC